MEEADRLRNRFAVALRDQEIQQRENLNQALSQSDARLETVKAALLLAEKKAADSCCRALQLESNLEDALKKIHSLEVENRFLRDGKARVEQEKMISMATAHFTSYVTLVIRTVHFNRQKALKQLRFIHNQANMDEDALRESICLLKSQLQDATARAEKCQTDLELSKEEQIRLLNQNKALETRVCLVY